MNRKPGFQCLRVWLLLASRLLTEESEGTPSLFQSTGMLLEPKIVLGGDITLGGAVRPPNGSFRKRILPFMGLGVAVGEGEPAAAAMEGTHDVTPGIDGHIHLEEAVVNGIRTLVQKDESRRGSRGRELGDLVIH